jgi:hypothetical protein
MNIECDLTPKGTQLLSEWYELREYYRKSPHQLAQEYISDPKSLTKDKIERLIHEAGKEEEKLIEGQFSIEDPILRKIIERNSHRLSNGSEIFL